MSCQEEIYCDEKGYPVCDKSVEALSLLQRKLLGQSMDKKDPVRMKEVRTLERLFHQSRGFVGYSNPVD
ncbi:conserved domain protein [delta proteobacterium NaphS2]|nr:conserved domain protein [delta proteobacterium NaphS2]